MESRLQATQDSFLVVVRVGKAEEEECTADCVFEIFAL